MDLVHTKDVQADGYPVGRRLSYLDRDPEGPDKVTVRVGVVADMRAGNGLVPMVASEAPSTEPRLITAADVIGTAPPPTEPNRHGSRRVPNHLGVLRPRTGRHRRREIPERPPAGAGSDHT
jgi:hypothetical protein